MTDTTPTSGLGSRRPTLVDAVRLYVEAGTLLESARRDSAADAAAWGEVTAVAALAQAAAAIASSTGVILAGEYQSERPALRVTDEPARLVGRDRRPGDDVDADGGAVDVAGGGVRGVSTPTAGRGRGEGAV